MDVVIRAMLTMNRWKVPDAAHHQSDMEVNKARACRSSRRLSECRGKRGRGRGGVPLAPEQQALLTRGAEVYNGLCISCHAPDGTGVPLLELKTTMARRCQARRV